MTIQIERVAQPVPRLHCSTAMEEFVKVVGVKLEVGESFLFAITSNHRNAISIIHYLTDKRFFVRRAENGQFRVTRTE